MMSLNVIRCCVSVGLAIVLRVYCREHKIGTGAPDSGVQRRIFARRECDLAMAAATPRRARQGMML